MTARIEKVSVKDLRARRDTLRADEAEQRARLDATTEQATRAMARGDPEDAVDHWIQEQTQADARIRTIQAAIREVEETIEICLDMETTAAARKRLDPALKRAAGSLAAEIRKSDKRVIQAAESLVDCLERAHEHRRRLGLLHNESEVLRARWPELPAPGLPPVPRESEEVQSTLDAARIALRTTRRMPPRLTVSHRASADEAERRDDVLRALRNFVQGAGFDSESETARIIAEAGIPEPRPNEVAQKIEAARARKEERASRELGPLAEQAKALEDLPVGGGFR